MEGVGKPKIINSFTQGKTLTFRSFVYRWVVSYLAVTLPSSYSVSEGLVEEPEPCVSRVRAVRACGSMVIVRRRVTRHSFKFLHW